MGQNARISTQAKWRAAAKTRELPVDIPSAPDRCYPEWRSWDAFFGTQNSKNRQWWSFGKAHSWVREKGIRTKEAWEIARQLGLVPSGIPSSPPLVYKTEWRGWRQFFGQNLPGGSSLIEHIMRLELAHFLSIALRPSRIRTASNTLRRVDIVSDELKLIIEYDGWFWHKHTIEKDYLAAKELRESGWSVVRIRESPLPLLADTDLSLKRRSSCFQKIVSVAYHLVDLGFISPQRRLAVDSYAVGGRLLALTHPTALGLQWRPYVKALEWSRALELRSQKQWSEYKRSHALPSDIPANPSEVYAVQWCGWREWLGTT